MKSNRFRPAVESLSVRIVPSELMAIVNSMDVSTNTIVVNDSLTDIVNSIEMVQGPNGLTYICK